MFLATTLQAAELDVMFLGPEDPVYNGDNVTIRLEAVVDNPDLYLLECKVYVNHALAKIIGHDAVLFVNEDYSVDILKKTSEAKEGDVLTYIKFNLVNRGHDFFGVYGCTYATQDDLNNPHPLNYGGIVPTYIGGLPSYYGNFDKDEDIDGKDIVTLIATMPNQTSYKIAEEGDFNKDDRVDWKDVAMFANCFGDDHID